MHCQLFFFFFFISKEEPFSSALGKNCFYSPHGCCLDNDKYCRCQNDAFSGTVRIRTTADCLLGASAPPPATAKPTRVSLLPTSRPRPVSSFSSQSHRLWIQHSPPATRCFSSLKTSCHNSLILLTTSDSKTMLGPGLAPLP